MTTQSSSNDYTDSSIFSNDICENEVNNSINSSNSSANIVNRSPEERKQLSEIDYSLDKMGVEECSYEKLIKISEELMNGESPYQFEATDTPQKLIGKKNDNTKLFRKQFLKDIFQKNSMMNENEEFDVTSVKTDSVLLRRSSNEVEEVKELRRIIDEKERELNCDDQEKLELKKSMEELMENLNSIQNQLNKERKEKMETKCLYQKLIEEHNQMINDQKEKMEFDGNLNNEKLKKLVEELTNCHETINDQEKKIDEKNELIRQLHNSIDEIIDSEKNMRDQLKSFREVNDSHETKIFHLNGELTEFRKKLDLNKRKEIQNLLELEDKWNEKLREESEINQDLNKLISQLEGEKKDSMKSKLEIEKDFQIQINQQRKESEKIIETNLNLTNEIEVLTKKLIEQNLILEEKEQTIENNQMIFQDKLNNFNKGTEDLIRSSDKERCEDEMKIKELMNRLNEMNLSKLNESILFNENESPKHHKCSIDDNFYVSPTNKRRKTIGYLSHQLSTPVQQTDLENDDILFDEVDHHTLPIPSNDNEYNYNNDRIFCDHLKLTNVLAILQHIKKSSNSNKFLNESMMTSSFLAFDEKLSEISNENESHSKFLKNLFKLNEMDLKFGLEYWKKQNRHNIILGLMKYKRANEFLLSSFYQMNSIYNHQSRNIVGLKKTIDFLEEDLNQTKKEEFPLSFIDEEIQVESIDIMSTSEKIEKKNRKNRISIKEELEELSYYDNETNIVESNDSDCQHFYDSGLSTRNIISSNSLHSKFNNNSDMTNDEMSDENYSQEEMKKLLINSELDETRSITLESKLRENYSSSESDSIDNERKYHSEYDDDFDEDMKNNEKMRETISYSDFHCEVLVRKLRRIGELEDEVNNLLFDKELIIQTTKEEIEKVELKNKNLLSELEEMKQKRNLVIDQFDMFRNQLRKSSKSFENNHLDQEDNSSNTFDISPIKYFDPIDIHKSISEAINVLKEDHENSNSHSLFNSTNDDEIFQLKNDYHENHLMKINEEKLLEFSLLKHLRNIEPFIGNNRQIFNKEKFDLIVEQLESKMVLLNKIYQTDLYKKSKIYEEMIINLKNEKFELSQQVRVMSLENEKLENKIFELSHFDDLTNVTRELENVPQLKIENEELLERNKNVEKEIDNLMNSNKRIDEENSRLIKEAIMLMESKKLFSQFLSQHFIESNHEHLTDKEKIDEISKELNELKEMNKYDGIRIDEMEYKKIIEKLNNLQNNLKLISTNLNYSDNEINLLKLIENIEKLYESITSNKKQVTIETNPEFLDESTYLQFTKVIEPQQRNSPMKIENEKNNKFLMEIRELEEDNKMILEKNDNLLSEINIMKDENKELRKTIEELESQQVTQTTSNKELVENNKNLKMDQLEQISKILKLNEKISVMENEEKFNLAQNEKLENDNNELIKEKRGNLKLIKEIENNSHRLEKEILNKMENNEKLKKEISLFVNEKSNVISENEKLKLEIEQMTNENMKLERKFMELKEEIESNKMDLDKMKEKVMELTLKNTNLSKKNMELVKEVGELETVKEELMEQIGENTDLLKENMELKKKLTEMERDNENLLDNFSQSTDEKLELGNSQKFLSEINENLVKELKEVQEDNETLKIELMNGKELENELRNLKEWKENVEGNLEEIENEKNRLKVEVDSLKEEKKKIELKLCSLLKREETSFDEDDEDDNNDRLLSMFHKVIQQKDDLINDIQNQLTNEKQICKEEIEFRENLIKEEMERSKEKEKSIGIQMENELINLKYDFDVKERKLLKEIDELKELNEDLNLVQKNYEFVENEEITQLTKEIEEMKEMKNEKEEIESSYGKIENRLKEFEEELEKIEKEKKEIENQFNELNEVHLLKKKENVNLNLENGKLSEQMEKLKENEEKNKNNIEKMREENGNLKNQLETLEEEGKTNLMEITKLTSQNYRNELLLEQKEKSFELFQKTMTNDLENYQNLLIDEQERRKDYSDSIKKVLTLEKEKCEEEMTNRIRWERKCQKSERKILEIEEEMNELKEIHQKQLQQINKQLIEEKKEIKLLIESSLKKFPQNYSSSLYEKENEEIISKKIQMILKENEEIDETVVTFLNLFQLNNEMFMKRIKNYEDELERMNNDLMTIEQNHQLENEKFSKKIDEVETFAKIDQDNLKELEKNIFVEQKQYKNLKDLFEKMKNDLNELKEEKKRLEENERNYQGEIEKMNLDHDDQIMKMKRDFNSYDSKWNSFKDNSRQFTDEQEKKIDKLQLVLEEEIHRTKQFEEKCDHLSDKINRLKLELWEKEEIICELKKSKERMKNDLNRMKQKSEMNLSVASDEFTEQYHHQMVKSLENRLERKDYDSKRIIAQIEETYKISFEKLTRKFEVSTKKIDHLEKQLQRAEKNVIRSVELPTQRKRKDSIVSVGSSFSCVSTPLFNHKKSEYLKKFLRAETFHKNLTYQKKYLIILLEGYQQTELAIMEGLKAVGLSIDVLFKNDVQQREVVRKKHRFRIVVRSIIAIGRMKFALNRIEKKTSYIYNHLFMKNGNEAIASR
ncbi:hypothetical protein SNEBB_011028 [Seison nebaliae]|nr:hypothetical protein SNEBB_011028 [Seison nebaliae]